MSAVPAASLVSAAPAPTAIEPPSFALRRRVVFTVATAGILTFLAPWGTQALPLPRRALAWLTMVAVWEVAVFAVGRGAIAWRGRRGVAAAACLSLPWLLAVMAVASLIAVPLCMLAVRGRLPPAMDCLVFYADSIGLGVIIVLIRWQIMRGRDTRTDPIPTPATSPLAVPIETGAPATTRGFLLRHAPQLAGGALLALASEDHYLRIHTDRGEALVLLRLRDAITSLGAATGVRVHRSFWVAGDVPARAARRGQAWQLDLPNGLSVPVSKANVAACRAAGWL